MITLGVFFGGMSVEHEISVISALQTIHAFPEFKYNIVPIYISKEGEWYTGPGLTVVSNYRNLPKLLSWCEKVYMTPTRGDFNLYRYKSNMFKSKVVTKIDIAFPILHGSYGEDGSLQGFFEMIGIPYVGSNLRASNIAMDKIATKYMCQSCGIPCVDYMWTTDKEWFENHDAMKAKAEKIGYPLIVKPATLGSSVGISKAANEKELEAAVDLAAKFTDKIIIERMVQNLQEINCSVYGSYHDCHASVLEEPIRSGDILSYKDKYMGSSSAKGGAKVGMKFGVKGGKMSGAKGGSGSMSDSQRKCPADLPEDVTKNIQTLAIKTFKEMNASGIIRIDFMRNQETGEVYVNEINAIPGSLSFYLWEATGKKFVDVLDEVINVAIKENTEKQKLKHSFDQNIFAMGGGAGFKMGGAKR
ncbi:MAG: D-alanine--D-alanine ligase [Bacteroidales bacterium]|nr:D-alanine--D-alanine ligase [Bacteroidales bacterium]